MKMKRKLMVVLVGFAACVGAQAQVNCLTSSKLACLVPFVTNAYLPNSSLSNSANEATANQASVFNGPIGAQLSQLPLAASAPGVVILTVNGNPQAFDNLGPILVDRPDSVGKGRLVFGFSFQQFNFNHLDGIPVGSIPFVYEQTSTGEYPTQYISQTEHVSLKVNQYVGLVTYGLPMKTDVSVVVPFSRVSIGAGNVDPSTYFITANNTLGPNFDLATNYIPGFARGIGDVSINVKHVLWSGGESGRGALAAGFALRTPTGDALNYLGSGAYGYNLYALASYKWKVSPHVKIGYQWNSNSVLLNPSGTGPNKELPGGVQYNAGADVSLTRSLTASGDIIANQFENAPSITKGSLTIPVSSAPPTGSTISLNTINVVTTTYTTADLSAGLKWRPFRKANIILYGNVLFQLNNVGLKADASPSGGISFSFRPKK